MWAFGYKYWKDLRLKKRGNLPYNQGYFCGGGQTSSNAPVATVNKLTYATKTMSVNSSSLSSSRLGSAGVSDSSSAGYIAGGLGTLQISGHTDKITYSNDTVASSTGITARWVLAGISNGTTGWLAGGRTGPSNQTNLIEKITLSNGSMSASSLTLTARGNLVSLSNSSTGYFIDGYSFIPTDQSGVYLSYTDKMNMSNETWTSQTAASLMPANRILPATASWKGNKGYFYGGKDTGGNVYNSLYAIAYSNDAASTITTTGIDNVGWACGLSDNPGGYGYFSGGSTANASEGNATQKTYLLTYSSEILSAQTTANLATGAYFMASVSGNESTDPTDPTPVYGARMLRFGYGF
jgi:hypothetical protein